MALIYNDTDDLRYTMTVRTRQWLCEQYKDIAQLHNDTDDLRYAMTVRRIQRYSQLYNDCASNTKIQVTYDIQGLCEQYKDIVNYIMTVGAIQRYS